MSDGSPFPSSLRREAHASWRFLLTVHAVVVREVDRALREAGCIPFEAYDVLITLHEAPRGRLRMSDLAGATLLSHSGISRSVGRLARQGYLKRIRCREDGRVYHATLTERGKGALHEAWPIYRKVLEELYVEACPDSTALVMNRFFGRILRDYAPERFGTVVEERRTDAPGE